MNEIQSTQYLSFRIDEEMFSLNVSMVREVLDMVRITRVPRMPDYIRGVINLRGSVVPVIDLGERMGFDVQEETEDTSIVVAEVDLDGETLVLGLICDAVDEVVNLKIEDIQPPPKVSKVDRGYISGMGKITDEHFLMILNLKQVMVDEDQGILTGF